MTTLVSVADDARRVVLRELLRAPGVRSVFVRRELRVPVAACLCVLASAVSSALFPVVALQVGAAIFGIPHVVSGFRHIALKRSLHPWTWAFSLGAIVLGLAALGGLSNTTPLFVMLFAVSIAGEAAVAPVGFIVRALVVLGVSGATLAATRWPFFFVVAVTHLHALSSLAFFGLACRRRGIVSWPLWSALVALVGLVTLGALDPLLSHSAWAQRLGPDDVVQILGHPAATANPIWLVRSLFLYAFGQSLHYMVWLRLMPEVDRKSPVPQSFSKALASFREDFRGWAIPVLSLCLAGGVAMLSAGRAGRDVYFTVVYFHIGMEAAALVRGALRSPTRGFVATCSSPRARPFDGRLSGCTGCG